MNKDLKSTYNTIKETSLFGRYINLNHIELLLKKLPTDVFKVSVLGYSVLNLPIYNVELGNGPIKILMWSQMHGNESTTTKALFDFFNYITLNKALLQQFSFKVIPMLNPDGSNAYTRVNANEVDLNRDAQNLSQPESKVLNTIYNDFNPHYCFNLHGQRTIFSAGKTNHTATLSFLAPAEDTNRQITNTRIKAMQVIVDIYNSLQLDLPNQIGRYDDSFNQNCVGDAFTMLKTPTILFEAGHFKDDYNRENVRYFTFKALLRALFTISSAEKPNYKSYFEIPENNKMFCDLIITNALINNELKTIEIQFEEYLDEDEVKFIGVIQEVSTQTKLFAHNYIDAKGKPVLNLKEEPITKQMKLTKLNIGADEIILKKD